MAQRARYPSLADRAVFVSGGASGIGGAIVDAFEDQGARVAYVDLAADARRPKRGWYKQCDVRDSGSLRSALTAAAEAVGPIRVLVNNAARDDRYAADEMTEHEWDEMQAVNVRHAFFAAQAVAAGMRDAGGGSIINFTSPSFLKKSPGLTAYATAKAGTIGLTRSLAAEYGRWGIRVNAVMPGWIFTERQKDLWVNDDVEAQVRSETLMPRLPVEADVASLVLFLASDDAEMLTAGTYPVDGGWI